MKLQKIKKFQLKDLELILSASLSKIITQCKKNILNISLSVIKNDISCSVYEISDSKVQNLFTRNSDHILPINSCCFIGNDKIATASDDHTCCVISIETQEVLYSFRFQSNVVSISSNPNSKNSVRENY